ncbi:DUF6659 family protein [Nitrosopumilus sp.]|uniref:DUF6659 family protein n=1 Tax=Nitrosopumilus sp. TaxID=2024843 RepID=UPI0026354F95|nr:DUF6659 family protein [Nitrosopumilus sp.]
MMIQITQNYERRCEELLEDSQFRFVGIINKLGNLIAGGFRNEITPFETEEKSRMMYMQMVLEVSMRKEFDETLGEIDYIASKRKNALMISIPINDELLLISVNPKSSTEEIVAKAIKVFKNSEDSDGV